LADGVASPAAKVGRCWLTPSKPTLKAPGTTRLKLKYVEPLSDFAFSFNSRHYTKGKKKKKRNGGGGGGGNGNGGSLAATTGALSVGPGRHVSPRHRMPFNSRNEGQAALHEVVGRHRHFSPRHVMPFYSRNEGHDALHEVVGRRFSPRHGMPFYSRNEGHDALHEVVGNVCQALAVGAPVAAALPLRACGGVRGGARWSAPGCGQGLTLVHVGAQSEQLQDTFMS